MEVAGAILSWIIRNPGMVLFFSVPAIAPLIGFIMAARTLKDDDPFED